MSASREPLTVSATELQRQPGRIVRAVLGGQRVTVTSYGIPVMRIVPIDDEDQS